MMDREALEYLVGLDKTEMITIGAVDYSTKQIFKIKYPTPAALSTTTLTSLIDYIKSGKDATVGSLLVQIISPSEVRLLSELRGDGERCCYLECNALTPSVIYGRFMNTESFNILLQSSFVANKDRDLLLKVVGNVKEENVKQVGDDGITQSATVKTGVATVTDVVVPNPVVLAPYRTFPEIEQPESKFIFRMQSGPAAAVFEADGGAWRNEAMSRIKAYLELNLIECKGVQVIS